MAKTMKVILEREALEYKNWCDLYFGCGKVSRCLSLSDIKSICPVLCKGLRKGQTRELILTQTKYGIKLELAKKERK